MSALSPACAHFRDHADELALGGPDAPLRHELLDHAARCSACQSHLAELSLVADRLLLLAPPTEPPPGFEGRVLERLANARGDGADAVWQRQRTARLRALAAAAVLLVVAVAGVTAGRLSASHTPEVRAVRSGQIMRADGSVAGTIRLVDRPRPLALITIDAPRKFDVRVSCSLVTPDWNATTVGSWVYADIEHGAWTVGIDASLLTAVRMNILDPTGSILATAQITSA